MSNTPITINDIHEICNTAWAQTTKVVDFLDPNTLDTIDFTKFSDDGTNTDDILKLREKYTNALLVQISNTYYKNRMEGVDLSDPYYEDSNMFGAITQVIAAKMPDAIENEAMQTFVSGESKTGVYTVYMPIVEGKLFIKQTAWEMPLSITGEQWNTAFKNQGELDKFVMYLMSVYYRACDLHSQNLSVVNRNGFIARKINANNGVYNLVQRYVESGRYEKSADAGDHTVTWDDLKNNKDFLMWVKTEVNFFMNRFNDLNNLYSTDTEPQSVPKDQTVCEFSDELTLRIKEADSYVYHNDILTLPNYREVTKWQRDGNYDIDLTISAFLGKDEQENDIIVKKQKILGIIVDRRGILHTNVIRRTPSVYHVIEDISHYRYQYVDKFLNNLDQKGIIFTANDYTYTISE